MPSKKAKANRPAGKTARSPKQDALERFREDPEGQLLTTDQGLAQHRDWGREAKAQNVPA